MRRMTALLFCLLAFAFALPAQGQTAITLLPCGLPLQSVVLTAQTTPKTFNLTEDCTPQITSGGIWMNIQSGEFTINGNGHQIQGGNRISNIIRVSGANAVLHLNNIIIFGNGSWSEQWDGIDVRAGTFNANDVTFNGNVYRTVLSVSGTGTRVNLTNVRFTKNRSPARYSARGGALNIWGSGIVVTIDGATFFHNANQPFVIRVNLATLRLRGDIKFESNPDGPLPGSGPVPHSAIPISLRDDGSANLDDSGARYLGVLAPRRKRKDPTPMPTSTATPRPQIAATHIALQASTGMTFRPAFGLDSGVYFRQLDGAGIGVQALIDAGFIDAVDVYGYAEQGVEVCFPHVGRVIFLDANTSPRAMAPLASTVVNGQTCVSIDSPGSLVLLPAD